MPEEDAFWDFYWEVRLRPMENLGKRAAILAASRLIRRLFHEKGRPVRVLEPGCGDGQVIGTLLDGHSQHCSSQPVVGIDYISQAIERCRRDFPGLQFWVGDFTDPGLLARLASYDLILLVNALHEVYSDTYSPETGEVDIPDAKQRVEEALSRLIGRLAPGGWLLLFDGIEPAGDPYEKVQIGFRDHQARAHFEIFVNQYAPFRIRYRESGQPLCVELSRRDFTRYITKSIFLGKHLWQSERRESYQYFTEREFRNSFTRQGLEIVEFVMLTVNDTKWRSQVEILTPGYDFPAEHVLILARRMFN